MKYSLTMTLYASRHPWAVADIAHWCEKCLGPQGQRWQMRSTYGYSIAHLVLLAFEQEKDAVMCQMTWQNRVKVHDFELESPTPTTMLKMRQWGEFED